MVSAEVMKEIQSYAHGDQKQIKLELEAGNLTSDRIIPNRQDYLKIDNLPK